MEKINNYDDIDKQKKDQILKMVTNSFYKELINYGINNSDIVTVSVNLLDHITTHQKTMTNGNGYYNKIFKVNEVKDDWQNKQQIMFNEVKIKPLSADLIPQVCIWLKNSELGKTLISLFPKETLALNEYFLNRSDRKYFSVYYQDDNFVGIIGAENIDHNFKKLEMKKFVGAVEYRSKGIGKLATFLFLYYSFNILKFNKVFIHSVDTNIKNVNLNSKFGFELEGILYKDAYLNNSYRDVLRMGLLQNTWDNMFSG
jgi:RimJ/RimL family protein N-acetyltransferase